MANSIPPLSLSLSLYFSCMKCENYAPSDSSHWHCLAVNVAIQVLRPQHFGKGRICYRDNEQVRYETPEATSRGSGKMETL